MRNWTERTGVYDDICYLRQAHLFQRFGVVAGFDTDLSRDDDLYFATLAREIGFPDWNKPSRLPCHTAIEATGKTVIQYPPGTGFFLSMFPPGFQRVPIYAIANLVIFLFALSAVFFAKRARSIILSGLLGGLALYFMINPAKASFSIAPTMIVCVTGGYLIVVMFAGKDQRFRTAATLATGFLLGLSVSFRIPNLFLSAGPFILLSAEALKKRTAAAFLPFVLFGGAYVIGLIPTLAANTVNAGGPLSTTYGPSDIVPIDLTFSIAKDYFSDLQGFLIITVFAWAAWDLRFAGRNLVSVVVLVNLVCNLLFFFSHPIFTPYYVMPIAMLSLWSLLFSNLMNDDLVLCASQSPSERPELARLRGSKTNVNPGC